MLRRAVIFASFALVLIGPASAAPRELIPGLTFDQRLEFTTRGPVVVNVLTVPRPGGLWSVKPVLSNETIPGTERLTAIEKRYSPSATVAGINGDLTTASGAPSGILMRGGALAQPPLPGRSSVGLDPSGALSVARVTMLATWQGSGPRRALNDVNGAAIANGVSLFTPAYGPSTPSAPGSFELTLGSFPPAAPNQELSATVTAASANGGTVIPPTGAVLVGRGTAATFMQKEAPAGQTVRIRLILKPAWAGVVNALGGGPVLVRGGKPIFRANEDFTSDQLLPRTARTAVGQLADGRLLLVTIDGSQPGYSAGVTNFELALEMVKLGAVTGAALDGGASSAMAFDGKLLSRPSAPRAADRRRAARRLRGVYLPQPGEAVLSPNGDGVADRQHLAYKVVRQSNVTVNLLGPDGVSRFTFSGPAAPGTYPFEWAGTKADGTPEVEGRWRWVVSAVDDLDAPSSGERDFTLNERSGSRRRSRPRSPFRVRSRARSRRSSSRARRRSRRGSRRSRGVVLRTFPKAQAGAGDLQVSWDGRTDAGAVVYSGRYVAEVTATNALGAVTLSAVFSVSRVSPTK